MEITTALFGNDKMISFPRLLDFLRKNVSSNLMKIEEEQDEDSEDDDRERANDCLSGEEEDLLSLRRREREGERGGVGLEGMQEMLEEREGESMRGRESIKRTGSVVSSSDRGRERGSLQRGASSSRFVIRMNSMTSTTGTTDSDSISGGVGTRGGGGGVRGRDGTSGGGTGKGKDGEKEEE